VISSMLVIDRATSAEPTPPTIAREDGSAVDTFSRIHHGSVEAVRCAGSLDTRGDARRKSWQRARPIARARDGADSDHARDADDLTRSLRSWRERLRSARQHSRRRRISSRASRSVRRSGVPCRLQRWGSMLGGSSGGRSLPAEMRAYVAALAPMIASAGRRCDVCRHHRAFEDGIAALCFASRKHAD
jgi:hypothetical protein